MRISHKSYDPRLEDIKIVEIHEASFQKSVPQGKSYETGSI